MIEMIEEDYLFFSSMLFSVFCVKVKTIRELQIYLLYL